MLESIATDLDQGESLFLLADLPNRPEVPRRNGKKLHRRVGYRWAISGVAGKKLETMVTPTGRGTTRGAVLRFFAALSGDEQAPQTRTPLRRQREQQRAEAQLQSSGFRF